MTLILTFGVLLLLGLAVLNSQGLSAMGSGSGEPQRPPAPNFAVGAIAVAIATAEGYYLGRGSIPYDYNNPGDITDYASLYGAGTNGITQFPTAEAGWNALYEKIQNILSGSSGTYDATASLSDIGATWSNQDPNWAGNVAQVLQVPTSSTLGDYAAAHPGADQ